MWNSLSLLLLYADVGRQQFCTLYQLLKTALCDITKRSRSKLFSILPVLSFQGFPVQQYGSGGMSGYPNQPLQYPAGPQQRCAPSPSYPSSRLPLMSQYSSGSHNPAQFPPGAGQPNPTQYYKVTTENAVESNGVWFSKNEGCL